MRNTTVKVTALSIRVLVAGAAIIAAAGLLVFVQALGFFITPALLGGSRVITLAMVIETQVVDLLDWSLASALAMVLLIVTVVLVIGFDRLLGLDKVWV